MKAIIIGATGATGKSLLPLLAAHSEMERIDCFGRRHPDFSHQKLNSHQIDFTQPNIWHEEVQGDVLFACLGTTLKAAGSKEAQWAIDYEANLEFAKAARENGVHTLVLVSASGANAASRLFYQRMKGELEQALIAFPSAIADSSKQRPLGRKSSRTDFSRTQPHRYAEKPTPACCRKIGASHAESSVVVIS